MGNERKSIRMVKNMEWIMQCPHCDGHNITWKKERAFCNNMGCDESNNGQDEIVPVSKQKQEEHANI